MEILLSGSDFSRTIFTIESNNNVKVSELNSSHPVIHKDDILALAAIIKDREQTRLNNGK